MTIVALSAPVASWADLVSNGGFETGDFSGWTIGGDPDGLVFVCATGSIFMGSVCSTESGMYAASMGPPTTVTLSQNLATTIGDMYDFTFFLRNDNAGGLADNQFSASWGGTTVFSETDAATSGYTKEEFTGLMASSANTPIQFNFDNVPGGFYLDNVSANAVPEPGNLARIVGVALVLLVTSRKRLRNP